jgi:hypothetical protein
MAIYDFGYDSGSIKVLSVESTGSIKGVLGARLLFEIPVKVSGVGFPDAFVSLYSLGSTS